MQGRLGPNCEGFDFYLGVRTLAYKQEVAFKGVMILDPCLRMLPGSNEGDGLMG